MLSIKQLPFTGQLPHNHFPLLQALPRVEHPPEERRCAQAPMISEQLFSRLGANFSTHEALEKGTLLGMEKRTVESALTRWCKKGLILRVQQGKYVRNDLKDKKKNG